MRIEVLCIAKCPHVTLAVERVRAALEFHAIQADVQIVTMGEDVGFAGSPTVLVNGIDVCTVHIPAQASSCRTYWTDFGVEGAPSIIAISADIEKAQHRGRSIPSTSTRAACQEKPSPLRRKLSSKSSPARQTNDDHGSAPEPKAGKKQTGPPEVFVESSPVVNAWAAKRTFVTGCRLGLWAGLSRSVYRRLSRWD